MEIVPSLARHWELTRRLATEIQPVPEGLIMGAVRQLFSALGISVSSALVKRFRTTAMYLAEGLEHGQAYRAAARRQRDMRQPPNQAQTRPPDARRRQGEQP